LVELDLYEAIWVGTNDEIDFSPINHDDLLDVVDDVRQLLAVDLVHAPVVVAGFEVSV